MPVANRYHDNQLLRPLCQDWRNMGVWVHWVMIGLLALVTIVLSITLIVVAQDRPLTPLEAILFQVVILAAGLAASYMIGKNAAMEAAREVIRPYTRSAFRRVLSLYKSMYNLSVRIEVMQEEGYDPRLDVIRAVVDEQIPSGRDALEDWRDIIPDDVDEMLQRYGENDDSGETYSRQNRTDSQ